MATSIPIKVNDDTRSLHQIGQYITSYDGWRNAFVNALVNRIAMVRVTSKLWRNKWSAFKKGEIELGETVEEVFVNLAKVHSYKPSAEYTEWMKREVPDVRTAFHTMNYQKYYKVTIEEADLRQAFLSWSALNDLIERIIQQLYTAMNYDEFVIMKYTLCRAILNGDVKNVVNSTAINTADGKKALVGLLRGYSGYFEYESTSYNKAGVYNFSEKPNQHIIFDDMLGGQLDVEVLALAFNMEKSEFIGHLHGINKWNEHDTTRLAELFANDNTYTAFTSAELAKLATVEAVLFDVDFPMIFDNFQSMRQAENGGGLYWQYWLHAWKTFSFSPYANAIVISSAAIQ